MPVSDNSSVRRRRSNRPIIGEKETDDNCKIRAASTYTYWHVYRLHPQTTAEEISSYLVTDFPSIRVEQLQSRNPAVYSSFKLTVEEKDSRQVVDPKIWPAGARINRFFLSKARAD